MMFQSTSVQGETPLRFSEPMGGLHDGLGRNTGNAARRLRLPGFHRLRDGLEAGCVSLDERSVLEAVTQDDVHHGEKKSNALARPDGKIEIRLTGNPTYPPDNAD